MRARSTIPDLREGALNGRQHQLRPQPANGRVAKLEIAAVKGSELAHDGEAEPEARLGFVEPQAAPRHLIALRRTKAGTVVIDDDAHDRGAIASFGHHFDADPHLRPLAGVVYEIADHFFQVLPLTAETHVGRRVEIDGDAAALMDLLHGAGQCGHDWDDAGDAGDHLEAGREPRPFQMPRDLVAHDAGLLRYLGGKRVLAPSSLVDHHR